MRGGSNGVVAMHSSGSSSVVLLAFSTSIGQTVPSSLPPKTLAVGVGGIRESIISGSPYRNEPVSDDDRLEAALEFALERDESRCDGEFKPGLEVLRCRHRLEKEGNLVPSLVAIPLVNDVSASLRFLERGTESSQSL